MAFGLISLWDKGEKGGRVKIKEDAPEFSSGNHC